ncbi:hypothetical protein B0H19DRAFT_947160, partial [Mycena capillaripes]
MNFQSLPLPPPRFQEPQDALRPVRQCGCNCIAVCRCACSCTDHCICRGDCNGDCAARVSRNLVVSLDEVPNKLGSQNTNVAELHSRILVDPGHEQLTYYDCAIGKHTSSHAGRINDLFSRIENTIDRAIGWTFRRNVLKAYRWLCEHYKPGDKLFLFGFSRGAYQVRTLAAMIDKVGLVNAANLGLLPSAYDVFLATQGGQDAAGEAEKFKTTFARSIKIHFVGVWDTVSSAGVGCSDPSSAERACIFRHALALDECRAKLLSAYTPLPLKLDQIPKQIPETKTNIKNIKEVWFAGKHLSSIPLLWMENEAASAGLSLRSRTSASKWKWEE